MVTLFLGLTVAWFIYALFRVAQELWSGWSEHSRVSTASYAMDSDKKYDYDENGVPGFVFKDQDEQ